MAGHFLNKNAASRTQGAGELLSLLILGSCFLLGILSGMIFAAIGQPSSQLSAYLSEYFQAAGADGGLRPAVWSVLWELLRWPAAALIFGFTALGVFCIPGLLMIRGFLLSYCISVFLRLFGGRGMLVALASFGVAALLTVPALMSVCVGGFRSSLSRVGKPAGDGFPPVLSGALTAQLPAAGVLAAAVILQWAVMPALLSAVCTRFFVP